jgi:hypothetical protein
MKLRGDERSQSIQIGAVILFGALVVLFSTYQAFVIPSQNQKVEFNHNQRVEGDMVDLRNEVLTTKTTGEDGYVSVELGTQFPARLLGLNPSPPSGTLSTTELQPFVVSEGGSPITEQVCPGDDHRTRFIEYRPSYSAYDGAGTIRYENSLLYHNFSDASVRMTSQQLVQGDTVQIIPLRRSFNQGGSGTIAVEPKAGLVDTSEVEDPTITLPTRLSNETWVDALDGQVAPENVTVANGNLTLTLNGTFRIDCGPVGLGETPPSGARGGGLLDINPAAPGDIRLQSETRNGNSEIVLTFNNTADANNFTEARIAFYSSAEPNSNRIPTKANITEGAGTSGTRTTLEIRGAIKSLNENIELPSDDTADVTLKFFNDGNDSPNLDPESWFVLELQLETGERATYFVPVPKK